MLEYLLWFIKILFIEIGLFPYWVCTRRSRWLLKLLCMMKNITLQSEYYLLRPWINYSRGYLLRAESQIPTFPSHGNKSVHPLIILSSSHQLIVLVNPKLLNKDQWFPGHYRLGHACHHQPELSIALRPLRQHNVIGSICWTK
jgi:hypothetical protein